MGTTHGATGRGMAARSLFSAAWPRSRGHGITLNYASTDGNDVYGPYTPVIKTPPGCERLRFASGGTLASNVFRRARPISFMIVVVKIAIRQDSNESIT